MEHVREELDRLIQQRRLGYSSISRMIGRNSSYIQQFIKRGSPRKLDDDDRRTLASFFGVDEQVLGGPPAPMRDGLIEIPVLNVDASAGFGAIAESETAHTRFGFDERWLGRLTRAKAPAFGSSTSWATHGTGRSAMATRCWSMHRTKARGCATPSTSCAPTTRWWSNA